MSEKFQELRGLLPLSAIEADALFNARKQHDRDAEEAKIKTLMASIGERGLLNDILVRDHGADFAASGRAKRYTIVHGHRRFEAHVRLGLEKISCKARVYTDEIGPELDNLAENVEREDLRPYDFARRAQDLHRRHKISYEEIGKRLGAEAGWVELQVKCIERLPMDLIEAFRNCDKSKLSIFLRVARESNQERMRATYNSLTAITGSTSKRGRPTLASGIKKSVARTRKASLVREAREKVVSGELGAYQGRALSQRERELSLELLAWVLARQSMPLEESP
jgi:ParB/RepB/Spo0J family partition protein